MRTLVTAALPYANGSIHIGHLVEYCQTDMYVRALKGLGEDALFICAADTHGTPIELNAEKQGIAPFDLAMRYVEEQQKDFARYDIHFDQYSHTHSETNRALVNEVYETLKAKGHIYTREVDGMWDEKAQRFLPDRFVRGTCPACKTPDQYGDVCENCKSTYSPRDLIDPKSVITGTTPVIRATEHVFFRLSDEEHVSFLREWTRSGAIQTDQANYVGDWIDKGLIDWDISRDAPYFGFEIPDHKDQFFYVWFDAPLCYVATSKEWGAANGVEFDTLWRDGKATQIEHVIGKDIVYFHTLFWPAVLRAAGLTVPKNVHVHGMLTVDGVKMSKSRGTFIKASVFADHVDPQAL
ncbi:MAG: methionine--tRNA ligase, partial [Myxococcota bacterium]